MRAGDAALAGLLLREQVVMHPFVLGELALGSVRNRGELLRLLARLPRVVVARDAEVLALIERAGLFGRGIGYIDAHLLAAARLTPGTLLWTRDRRLAVVADGMGVGVV